MKRYFLFFWLFIILGSLVIVPCVRGQEVTPESMSGTWEISELDIGCGEVRSYDYEVTIEQTGLFVVYVDGYRFTKIGPVLAGVAVYSEEGGTTTSFISALVFGPIMTGTASWTWSDEEEQCSGTATFIGSRISR